MLMSSFFLVSISTKIISSDEQKQQQEKSSKTSDKVKYVGKVALKSVVTIMAAVGPFMSVIEPNGPLIRAVCELIGLTASEITKKVNGDPIQALVDEFKNLKIQTDENQEKLKWDIWASNYYNHEIDIKTAWSKLKTLLESLKETKDVSQKQRHKDDFVNFYSPYEATAKRIQKLMTVKDPSLGKPLGDLLAEHVKCHEKDIRQFTVFINKLIYKANTMNTFYYNLKGIESQAKVDEEAKIAYKTASAMFQVHKKCIDNSMEYIKNDVETLIDNTKKSSDLAKEVCSFLVKEYDRYDWMVVAFKTKKSNKPFESLNSHVLAGFTDKTKGGISVAFARQVKGNHTKTALVKQTIGSCIKDSDKCHEVANKLRGCFEAKGGTSVTLPYTAVHAYLRKAHDSYNTQEETDEEDEVSAAPEDQAPAVYIGKCKKYLGPMSGKFVVLIKSDDEMEEKDPCSKLNCGGEERGKCVKVEGMFLAMCECKMPYYGEHCEESLEDYKKYLKGEKEMVESTQHDKITKL
ncbi:hypothetical protein PO909_029727 [Leuciscus waleckii]